MDPITDYFNTFFAPSGITLPAAQREARKPGLIEADGWRIRFVFGHEDQREHLDFYAEHRMFDDCHMRVYDDGQAVALESTQHSYAYNPRLPGDEEQAREAYYAHNQRVSALIAEKFAACVEHKEP